MRLALFLDQQGVLIVEYVIIACKNLITIVFGWEHALEKIITGKFYKLLIKTDRQFYLFILNLSCLVLLMTIMCVANLWI